MSFHLPRGKRHWSIANRRRYLADWRRTMAGVCDRDDADAELRFGHDNDRTCGGAGRQHVLRRLPDAQARHLRTIRERAKRRRARKGAGR